ncbi:DUF2510 domain-containing protein [Streptomyces sp. AA1529]|uniref:DUF2510 domain-containing protein n=1 Tax=Streptomyces sp. AA1529 TaxID=1203257 RepID=UPI003D738B94
MTTPPGWYPDPGQTPPLPPQQRWWDGTAWTQHTRPAAGTAAGPGGGKAGRGPLIAGIVGAVVLVAALAVGGVLVAGGSDDEEPKAAAGSSPSPESSGPDGKDDPPGDRGDRESPAPESSPGDVVPEPGLGVGLTVPGGWQRPDPESGFVAHRTTYRCPGEETDCVRGGAKLLPVSSGWEGEKALKGAAELQVAENAKQSYSEKAYGGITDHKVVESGAVTVAGQPGYRVRWRVENKLEPDAYVEAVVFRSPHVKGGLLALWSSVDIAPGAPPASDLDELRKGVVRTGTGEGADDGDREAV